MTVKSAGRYWLGSGNQSVTSHVKTKVQVNTIEFDLLNDWDSTNKRLVVPEDGLYHLVGKIFVLALGANKFACPYLYINGVQEPIVISKVYTTGGDATEYIITTIPLTAGDYVELYCYHNHGAARNVSVNCALNWAWFGEIS